LSLLAKKAVSVELTEYEVTGKDAFNRDIKEPVTYTINKVLIGEPSSDDVTNELNLSGRRIAYTLAIPKGDTHSWVDADVTFFGEKFHTIGVPTQGIEALIPLEWNKKVKVERYE